VGTLYNNTGNNNKKKKIYNACISICLLHAVSVWHRKWCICDTSWPAVQGHSQDFTMGGHRRWVPKGLELRRRGGENWRRGPQPTRGSGRASWAPPAGTGQSPGRQRIFLHIWGPQNTSGRENTVTLAIFSVKNPLNRRLGGMAPWPSSDYAPAAVCCQLSRSRQQQTASRKRQRSRTTVWETEALQRYRVLMSRDRYGTPLLRSSLMMPCGSRPVTEIA